MLIDYMQDYQLIRYENQPDGYGGTKQVIIAVGEPFKAGLSRANASEQNVAMQRGLIIDYNVVTIDKVLKKDDLIQCMQNGKRYRITSNSDEIHNPARTFTSKQCTAQRVKD